MKSSNRGSCLKINRSADNMNAHYRRSALGSLKNNGTEHRTKVKKEVSNLNISFEIKKRPKNHLNVC
jgi:hypothetical protein